MRGGPAAVGERCLDDERIASVDPGWPGGRREKFAGHHLPDARQQTLLADRHHAVGRRWWNLRVLDRFEERVGFAAAKLARGDPGGELGDITDLFRRAVRYAGKRLREELGHCELRMLLQHRHEAAEFDAVGMRLDLLRLRRQVVGGPFEDPLGSIRPLEVDAGVRVRDRRLLEILLDAAAAALELRLHLDRHAGAVVDGFTLVVLGDPFDLVLRHQVSAALARGDVDAFPLPFKISGWLVLVSIRSSE